MGAELALSLIAVVFSIGTFAVLLTLLGRKDLDYASRREHGKLDQRVTQELDRLQYSLSQLYRYVEAVDDHTGARGYRVLGRHVPRDDTKAREG